jgi:hypothetical protein
MTTQDPVRPSPLLKAWLSVWLAATAFWLLTTVLAGAAFFVVLLLGPVALAGLAFRYGLDGLPAPVVYLLGCTPAALFPFVQWHWPIGLLILVMIFAYEKVLEGISHLRAERGEWIDEQLVGRRAITISLVLITIDAQAVGMDVLLALIALVAAWKFTPAIVTVAFLGAALTAVTFLGTGEPALFAAIGGFQLQWSTDSDWLFAAETMAGLVLAWGGATWWVWRNR